jgi:hypothetical protein
MRPAAIAGSNHSRKRKQEPCRARVLESTPGDVKMPETPVAPQMQIQLQIDEQIAQGMYVNMAMLNHNETEFVIDFIYVQPQAPKAVVRARVINSPKHMKRLLAALQDNVAKYETQFGKIDVSGPVPHLGMQH